METINTFDTLQAQTAFRTPATRLEMALLNLVRTYNALADDYYKTGFIDPEIYGNSRRALHNAEKNVAEICTQLRAGENINDVWMNRANRNE